MERDRIWTLESSSGPLIATAIHAGHLLRPEVATRLVLSEADRLREEDPFTDDWLSVADCRIAVTRSRFEVDVNRPRYRAVYRKPDDAWGLELWRSPPSNELVGRSLALYDDFYAMLAETIEARLASFDSIVLFDLHAYNHRRNGPDAEPQDPVLNPEVNVGTATMDREHWARIVDEVIATMRAPVEGTALDVRENVRFRGGNMVRWLHETYPRRVCAIAIEIKKTYMDEWTGVVDRAVSRRLHASLRAAAEQIRDSLAEPCSEPQPTPSPAA